LIGQIRPEALLGPVLTLEALEPELPLPPLDEDEEDDEEEEEDEEEELLLDEALLAAAETGAVFFGLGMNSCWPMLSLFASVMLLAETMSFTSTP
jgi:hypothetical protein